jgi:hypothetical protein
MFVCCVYMLCCPVKLEVSATGWSLVQKSPTLCLYVWLRNAEKGGQRSILDYSAWGYYGIVIFVVKLRAELCVKNMQTQCQCFIIYVCTKLPVRRNLMCLFCPPCLAPILSTLFSGCDLEEIFTFHCRPLVVVELNFRNEIWRKRQYLLQCDRFITNWTNSLLWLLR